MQPPWGSSVSIRASGSSVQGVCAVQVVWGGRVGRPPSVSPFICPLDAPQPVCPGQGGSSRRPQLGDCMDKTHKPRDRRQWGPGLLSRVKGPARPGPRARECVWAPRSVARPTTLHTHSQHAHTTKTLLHFPLARTRKKGHQSRPCSRSGRSSSSASSPPRASLPSPPALRASRSRSSRTPL